MFASVLNEYFASYMLHLKRYKNLVFMLFFKSVNSITSNTERVIEFSLGTI